MKVFRDRILIDEVPDIRRRPEGKRSSWEFFPRLVGINVSSDGNPDPMYLAVEPVYMPLVRADRGEGSTVIWVNSRERPLWMITLARRWPFIQFFRYNWLLLDTDW